ncbi:hypothetical protein K2X85_09420 [bacterium]|nr:hypothetical protein [bacterium]
MNNPSGNEASEIAPRATGRIVKSAAPSATLRTAVARKADPSVLARRKNVRFAGRSQIETIRPDVRPTSLFGVIERTGVTERTDRTEKSRPATMRATETVGAVVGVEVGPVILGPSMNR